MTKLVLIGMVLGGTMAMAAPAAQATVYDYNFETNDDGPVASMIGTFTTAGPATPYAEITGMTGTLYNSLDTVTGVLPNPTWPAFTGNPGGEFFYTNTLYSTQPYLDNYGLGFTTADTPTGDWNLYGAGGSPTVYGLFSTSTSVDEFGTLTVTEVPEPSTWAMMALGFAGLSLAAGRRTRRLSALAA
jgi:PEP-CTERM motif-containing protein